MKPVLRAGVLLLLLSLAIYSCQNAPQPTEAPTADLGAPPFNTTLVAFEQLPDIALGGIKGQVANVDILAHSLSSLFFLKINSGWLPASHSQ